MQSDSPSAFLRALAHSPPPPSRSPRRYPPRAPASSLAPIIIFLVLPRKAKPLFCPCRAEPSSRGEVAGASRDERAAPRGTPCNGRGRAEEPGVCRERGGGEAPGASMSRLDIYAHIFVSWGSPPCLPRPGRAGRGAPGRRGTFRGRAQAAVEGLSPPVWGPRVWVGGLPGPCNSMLGSVREGVVRHLLENCFLSFYFQFFYEESFKNDLHHKWSWRGGGWW